MLRMSTYTVKHAKTKTIPSNNLLLLIKHICCLNASRYFLFVTYENDLREKLATELARLFLVA